ncbi:T9SSC-terminal target domain-containing protein [Haloferula helveola]|uniref:T9SSC-terminal target domain-containing protein n=1 Tax=Haloferula helveola TaxID=490095 RepID=A0ABM7RBY1_9BACT|nr:T9SSC-terminal target domain-containing protein [Haloferula helveola]
MKHGSRAYGRLENLGGSNRVSRLRNLVVGALVFGVGTVPAVQGQEEVPRQFPPGAIQKTGDLPASPFRDRLESLPAAAREKALAHLRSFHFPASDVDSLQVDPDGGICYACSFGHTHRLEDPAPAPAEEPTDPTLGEAAVPVSPFPEHLKFHSRPGLTKRIYINFSGQNVTGTAWNNSLGRSTIFALPFSTDSDTSTFSDSEQAAIKRIWQRMAEDFAPFDIDVTTEPPPSINNTTAVVLITRNTDANGDPNPSTGAGGVAYVNVFGRSDFISTYSPAWVYSNNLGNGDANIAEAASHEAGHNLGLSHDATSTSSYYGGHGSSSNPISWGPIMGTGYGRNVTQWSKGEYYNANNTQDDLAIIAGKVSYRSDDHGNTPGAATPLSITGGTTVSSTTPENDPTNSNPANKGILERNTDVDVFSFVSGAGTVTLNVNPWDQPAGTNGGNLDVLLELRDENGVLIATDNPSGLTTASITATVGQGVYYLYVRNTGTGDPLSSPPTGYTAYGSIGQYFISGTIVDGSGIIIAPVAEAQLDDLADSGQSTHTFTVTYSDDLGVNVASIGTGDVRVTGPGGYDQLAQLVSVDQATNGTPRVATYSVSPSGGGTWSAADNGTYVVTMQATQVQDIQGASVADGVLGQFEIDIPVPLFSSNMTTDPGWTLGANWSYGQPSYGNGGPNGGYTGTDVIGHSMSSDYAKGLAMSYATTPLITNAGGSSSLTLKFRRWLGLKRNDTAIVQVSGDDGATWSTLWSSTANLSDSSWQSVQYPLPLSVIGSSQIRFRWGLASLDGRGNSPTAIGWHIDDLELLGGGALDASPPSPALSAADITDAGSPTQSCTVTFTDATAVLGSSVDVTDLLVTGPAGPLNPLTISSVGTDLTGNGSPLGATYTIDAPGGTWEAVDNGVYTITLQEGAVEDTLANTTPEAVLGNFSVNISTLTPGVLAITAGGDLEASGTAGGPFAPASVQYTLTNTGEDALDWSVSKSVAWLDLSATAGTLAGGASAFVTATVNAAADTLAVGSYSDSIIFSNDTNTNGNTTRSAQVTVMPIPVTVTLGNLSQTYDGGERPVTVTTDPTPVAYTVTYDGATSVPVDAGSYAVVATVTEPNHTGSASGTLVVAKASQTISFDPLADLQSTAAPLTLGGSASSGLTVSYTSSDPSVATVSGDQLTPVGPGTTTIAATQSGDSNFESATPVTQTLTVIGPVDHFTISSIGSPLVVGTPVGGITLTAIDAVGQTASGFNGAVTFGGTGGFTGTSASFADGVLTGVTVTPTVAGTDLTLTVDDGAGHTGSVTIALIQSRFEVWSGGAAFDSDSNGDGVQDGLAWLLGAADPGQDSLQWLPSAQETGGGLVLSFRCLNAAARGGATLELEHSSSLGTEAPWSSVAVPETSGNHGGIDFTITPDGDYNQVSVTVPGGVAGRLFARLRGTAAP